MGRAALRRLGLKGDAASHRHDTGHSMLPNFIVIGAAKCATTSVYDLLRGHPQVFMSNPKEPNYFSKVDPEDFEASGAWYRSLFEGAGEATAVGEASVNCTHPTRLHVAPGRVHNMLPDAKLVFMVRHPIRRLESDWRMMRQENRASGTIKQAFGDDLALLNWGFYWRALNAYRALYPDEQILVLFFEDFVKDPRGTLRQIFRHIGVDPAYEPDDADRPRLAAGQMHSFGRLGSRVRDSSTFRALRPIIPKGAVELGKRLLGRQSNFEVEWDKRTLRMVIDLYREDSLRILEHCGKPPDFWNLDVDDPANRFAGS